MFFCFVFKVRKEGLCVRDNMQPAVEQEKVLDGGKISCREKKVTPCLFELAAGVQTRGLQRGLSGGGG